MAWGKVMENRIQQLLITQTDALHGSLGAAAVLNGLWTDLLNPAIQVLVTLGGLVYLYYMIRAKRTEWLLNKSKLEKENPK